MDPKNGHYDVLRGSGQRERDREGKSGRLEERESEKNFPFPASYQITVGESESDHSSNGTRRYDDDAMDGNSGSGRSEGRVESNATLSN